VSIKFDCINKKVASTSKSRRRVDGFGHPNALSDGVARHGAWKNAKSGEASHNIAPMLYQAVPDWFGHGFDAVAGFVRGSDLFRRWAGFTPRGEYPMTLLTLMIIPSVAGCAVLLTCLLMQHVHKEW
jgi:hypothetical protein